VIELPYRGPGVMPGQPPPVGRPTLQLPPARMPAWRGLRPLKRWRYVGVFAEELMLCVGDVHVGPARQTFWALWDRGAGVLSERTASLRHRAVRLSPERVVVADGKLNIDLMLDEVPGIETVCRNGASYAWTRKQGGVRAHGTVTVGGRRQELDACAVIDDSAGYHARETSWFWSAGIGLDRAGAAVAWNLVQGINDPPLGSERSIWVDGVAREPGPVRFEEHLGRIVGTDGLDLRFSAEALRERHDNMLLVRSEYRQPFGGFSGALGAGQELERGLGVMERHHARW
jgi:Protein of unknown function (DUF2804)